MIPIATILTITFEFSQSLRCLNLRMPQPSQSKLTFTFFSMVISNIRTPRRPGVMIFSFHIGKQSAGSPAPKFDKVMACPHIDEVLACRTLSETVGRATVFVMFVVVRLIRFVLFCCFCVLCWFFSLFVLCCCFDVFVVRLFVAFVSLWVFCVVLMSFYFYLCFQVLPRT